MIYPTINELTKGEFNRYQLTLATAKCARLITDEYVKQRAAAETALTGSKEGGSTIASMIDPALANEKAVKNAINELHEGKYVIVEVAADEVEDDESAIND
jgi:DNA-directed RNA polymerase subunit K/omega